MSAKLPKYTQKPFAEALGEIMREQYGDRMGNFDLRPVLSQVETYSYEALRLMLKGQRSLKLEAIEGIATVIGVSPHYFVEYRRMWSAAMAERYPELAEELYEVTLRFVSLRQKTGSTDMTNEVSEDRKAH
jgi:hypothetical protein